jgi:hypothetical protein
VLFIKEALLLFKPVIMRSAATIILVLFTVAFANAQTKDSTLKRPLLAPGIYLEKSATQKYWALGSVALGTGFYLLHGKTTEWAHSERRLGQIGLMAGLTAGLCFQISSINLQRKAGYYMGRAQFSLQVSPSSMALKYRF